MRLPEFRYHPDPVATGSVVPSGAECVCCGQVRGYIYSGPVFSVAELDQSICPWCIAGGSAHAKFDAEFTDSAGVGGYVVPKTLPESVVAEVAFRTPGFSGWQQEHWLACCNDAAQFLGRAGHRELQSDWPQESRRFRQIAGSPGQNGRSSFAASVAMGALPLTFSAVCTVARYLRTKIATEAVRDGV